MSVFLLRDRGRAPSAEAYPQPRRSYGYPAVIWHSGRAAQPAMPGFCRGRHRSCHSPIYVKPRAVASEGGRSAAFGSRSARLIRLREAPDVVRYGAIGGDDEEVVGTEG